MILQLAATDSYIIYRLWSICH